MTVLAVQGVEYRRFNGYRDPRYPEGMWMGGMTVTGDATGGLMVATLHFNVATDVISSRIFSLEAIGGSNGTVANVDAALEVVNLGGPLSLAPLGFRRIYRVFFRGVTSFGAALELGGLSFMPLFLGAQQEVTVTSQIALSKPNVDLQVQTFEAEGYWWGPRSVLQEGGPQRPPTGLYRA